MKKLVINPVGWSCTYKEAPPGHIIVGEQLCFKSEYHTSDGRIEGYNSSGEFLCIADTELVQSVIPEWFSE